MTNRLTASRRLRPRWTVRPQRRQRSCRAKPRAIEARRDHRRRGDLSSIPALRLFVGLALAHDLLRGEVDAAARERIADEEVVALRRVIVGTFLQVRVFGLRERQLDRLWHHL